MSKGAGLAPLTASLHVIYAHPCLEQRLIRALLVFIQSVVLLLLLVLVLMLLRRMCLHVERGASATKRNAEEVERRSLYTNAANQDYKAAIEHNENQQGILINIIKPMNNLRPCLGNCSKMTSQAAMYLLSNCMLLGIAQFVPSVCKPAATASLAFTYTALAMFCHELTRLHGG